ncbi:MAG TPA: hypothetical protein DCG19_01310 [Cryomorphaceae bacterium]|nr:hypothetical protein [Owenweeksia sp.]MBF99951.1 hypothetical protein [Owenweeksia sp.]HAD96007.1 hypothetical protein [Cryomorphaceae bacterium]HBF20227.1 hypothetical protein [Cryomorphaceae bacterium]|tara:strand:+ start:253 stop:444 length:192 start_codon:yes stop_codon:yes gene_type:complete
MQYKIQQIGARFSDKGIVNLEKEFNSYSSGGYKYHSVIEIQKTGCLGIGKPSITYIAIFAKEE